MFSLGPRPHVLRLLSVLRSILHCNAFLIEIIELGSDTKYLKNPGNIWKLNTSANDLPMKPLSKRSRTSCPHYCIGPVPGHFDHWIDWFVSFDQMLLYSCLMKQTTGLVFLLLLFKQRHHLTSDNRFKEHDESTYHIYFSSQARPCPQHEIRYLRGLILPGSFHAAEHFLLQSWSDPNGLPVSANPTPRSEQMHSTASFILSSHMLLIWMLGKCSNDFDW